MDAGLKKTLDYVKWEVNEIERLSEEGKLTDKGVFIRIFCLGKICLGWDDDVPAAEQIEYLTHTNEIVESYLEKARKFTSS